MKTTNKPDYVLMLAQLIDSCGARVTFDRERNITHPCWLCGAKASPAHRLFVLAVSADAYRDAMRRPVCNQCATELAL